MCISRVLGFYFDGHRVNRHANSQIKTTTKFFRSTVLSPLSFFSHSLSSQLNVISEDTLQFCCPALSSQLLVVTQTDFTACNTTTSNLVVDVGN